MAATCGTSSPALAVLHKKFLATDCASIPGIDPTANCCFLNQGQDGKAVITKPLYTTETPVVYNSNQFQSSAFHSYYAKESYQNIPTVYQGGVGINNHEFLVSSTMDTQVNPSTCTSATNPTCLHCAGGTTWVFNGASGAAPNYSLDYQCQVPPPAPVTCPEGFTVGNKGTFPACFRNAPKYIANNSGDGDPCVHWPSCNAEQNTPSCPLPYGGYALSGSSEGFYCDGFTGDTLKIPQGYFYVKPQDNSQCGKTQPTFVQCSAQDGCYTSAAYDQACGFPASYSSYPQIPA